MAIKGWWMYSKGVQSLGISEPTPGRDHHTDQTPLPQQGPCSTRENLKHLVCAGDWVTDGASAD